MDRPVNVFSPMKKALKVVGLASTTNGIKSYLWTFWNYVVLFNLIEFFAITTSLTIIEDTNIYLKLEYVAFIMVNASMGFRLFVLAIRKKRLFSLFDKIETLLQQIEVESGTNSLPALRRKCRNFAYFFAIEIMVVCFNACIMSYLKYYAEGVEDPVPLQVALPFSKKNNIHAVVWYEVFQFFGTATAGTVTNILFLTLSATTSELIRKVAESFEKIDELNVDYLLKRTVKWHSEVIKITKETNDILGITIFVDAVLALLYISVMGFLLVRIGLDNSTNLSKYLVLYLGLLVHPIFVSLSGHSISSTSDLLYAAIYNNKWYRLEPKARRDLIVPAMIARKGLSWNFRGFIQFDMPFYLALVKQSYSLITFLKMIK